MCFKWIKRKILYLLILLFYLWKLWCTTIFSTVKSLAKILFFRKEKSLEKEVILIVDACSAVGRKVCMKLNGTGAKIICWHISRKEIEILTKELLDVGTDAYGFEIDVTQKSQIETAGAMIKEDLGSVTMIINCDPVIPYCRQIYKTQPTENNEQLSLIADEQLPTNSSIKSFSTSCSSSHIWIINEFLPAMIDNRRGHIVTLYSTDGLSKLQNLLPSCATQNSIHGYIDSLKQECSSKLFKSSGVKFTTAYVGRFPNSSNPFNVIAGEIIEAMKLNKSYVYVPGVHQQAFDILTHNMR